MKIKTKRILSLVLALILCLSLVSCGKEDGKKNDKKYVSVAGYDVDYEVLSYVIMSISDMMPDADDKEIKDSAINVLRTMYAPLILCDKYEVPTEGENVDYAVESRINEIKGSLEDGEFDERLKESHMTEESLRFVSKVDYLQDEAFYAYLASDEIDTDDDAVLSVIKSSDFAAVKQVLICTEDSIASNDGTYYTPAKSHTDKEAKELCEKVRELALSGEDFDSLVAEYGESLYMMSNSDGYYICHGMWDDVNEEAVFALGIGEISDVVKSSAGYSVFLRIEKDDAYITENLDTIANNYFSAKYTLLLEDAAENAEVKTTENFDNLKISDFKD